MRVAVASHATIDHIVRMDLGLDADEEGDSVGSDGADVHARGGEIITIGGPVCYASLMASRLHDIMLVTRVGIDFRGYADTLSRKYGISIPSTAFCDLPTTRFRLVMMVDGNRQSRSLFLLARCADITQDTIEEYIRAGVDACIISPVINEISMDAMRALSGSSGFTFLDPQGMLRRVDSRDGSISLMGSSNLKELRIDAIKVDLDEAYALTGMHGYSSLNILGKYSDTVILSMDNRVLMRSRGKVYELTTDIIASRDSTGAGDIFAGAYTSAYVSNRDVVWALCYGVAAAYIALASGGLGLDKVPCNSKDVEDHAYMLLERVHSLAVS
ncbi:MAG: PfkB family carbohydrate kinase [Nitrososphaera sp.]|nr:PfkB family carbohydrate kinase [Candidatus Nitrosocaldus islandicus]